MSQTNQRESVSLESLRSEVKPFQRTMLDEVWSYFHAKGEWPVLRHMYSRHGKKQVVECLSPLGAGIVQEHEDSMRGGRCVLYLTGVFMTSEGPKFRALLGRFFQFQWNLFKSDPEKLQITAKEITTALTLKDEETATLGLLLFLGYLGGSNRLDLTWSVRALREVEGITTLDELNRYVDDWILSGYRRGGPVFQEDRKKEITPMATQELFSLLSHQTEFEPKQIHSNDDPFKRRYQVFVSSTYQDLIEERQAVMHALLELDCIPSGMELFPAADDDQWTLIKRVIDDCDYYIVIIAGRYGSVAARGVSYTQMEYEYALSKNKPVIAFLHKNPAAIQVQKFENTDEGRMKLTEFRALAEKKVCKYWTSPDELGSVVSRSLIQLIKTKPAIGWVKGNLVTDESSAQEILKLRRQIEEMEGLVPKRSEVRPSSPPVEYLTKLAEAFPRNAIQETWLHVENTLRYAVLTHGLDDSEDFPNRLVALFAHGDLDSERNNALVEFYKLAEHAKSDPAFQITSEDALKTINEMTSFSMGLIERCDNVWNLRKSLGVR